MYIAIEAMGDIRMGSEEKMTDSQLRSVVGGALKVQTGVGRLGRRLAVVTADGTDGPGNLLATMAAHRCGIIPEDEILRGTALFAAERRGVLMPLNADEAAALGIILGVLDRAAAETA